MTFRDREKQRLLPLKPQLFSAEACEPGFYRNVRRCFCLHEDHAEENLHATVRDKAMTTSRHAGSAGTMAKRVTRATTCVVPSAVA